MYRFLTDLWAVISSAGDIAAILLFVGGIISYFFRERIRQSLTRAVLIDVENAKSNINHDLAEQAARHQRELEAYKVTLIAETEQIRAEQEIKKTLALRIAERKFIAISNLLDAFSGLPVDVGSLVSRKFEGPTEIEKQAFIGQANEVLARLNRFNSALYAASPMLDIGARGIVIDAQNKVTKLLSMRTDPAAPPVNSASAEMQAAFSASYAVEKSLGEILASMERLK